PRRIAGLPAEADHLGARVTQCHECLAVRGTGGLFRTDLVTRQVQRSVALRDPACRLRFVYIDPNVAFPAELRDRRIRIRYRLAVGVVLILDLRGTLALHGACDDRGGLFVTGSGEQRLVDLLDVVTVDL